MAVKGMTPLEPTKIIHVEREILCSSVFTLPSLSPCIIPHADGPSLNPLSPAQEKERSGANDQMFKVLYL